MRVNPVAPEDHKKYKIVFFTIAIDSRDPVLAQNVDWVIGLAQSFREVNVFAFHVGDYPSFPGNVKIFHFGGKSIQEKIRGMLNAIRLVSWSIGKGKGAVLYHMTTWPILFFGPLFKLRAWKQGVWYSHNYADWPLRITGCFIDKYFSPTIETFPLEVNSKLIATGHSLDFSSVSNPNLTQMDRKLDSIFCIGRIAPVKRIEILLQELAVVRDTNRNEITVTLLGPTQDQRYLEFLQRQATSLGIVLAVMGPMGRSTLLQFLKQVKFIFNGTPRSVDKSALEACASGAILISNNEALQHLTGMDWFWQRSNSGKIPEIHEQINNLLRLSNDELNEIASHIQITTRVENDLVNTLRVIKTQLT